MTNVRRLTSAAAVSLALVAGAGCVIQSDDPPSAQTTETTESPSSTDSNGLRSDSEVAATAAEATVRDYFRVVDELRQQPTEPLSALKGVSASGELSAQQRLIESERDKELRQVGETRIADLQVQAVNLDDTDPRAGRAPTVQVDVCWSVVDVDIVDGRGRSVVTSSRPDSGWIRFTVANYRWSSSPDDGWRVASSQDLRQKPCVAS